MSKPKTYKLVHIQDILDIPEESFENFLIDLQKWHSVARDTKNLIDTVSEATGIENKERIAMNWIDDGKHEGRVIFKSKGTDNAKQ